MLGSFGVKALALRASAIRARVMMDASAIRARAAMGLGDLRSDEGFRRAESRRRSEGAALPRMDDARSYASLSEHMTGGGILSIGVGCCGELSQ